jgi:hypothetical protein
MANDIALLQTLLAEELETRKVYETLCDSLRAHFGSLVAECASLQGLLHEERMKSLALAHLVNLQRSIGSRT